MSVTDEGPARGTAVIADIVGSRGLRDRAAAQEAILAAFAAAEEAVPARIPAWATVGDEFQALHADWSAAVRATLRVAVALPEGVELRFGLGDGVHREVAGAADDDGRPILDGSAWHRAREALEAAEHRTRGLAGAYRGPDADLTAAVDGQLLVRDHVLRRLKARERRIAAALLAGRTQAETATAERITQGAVSQAVARSGVRELLALDAALGALPGAGRGAKATAEEDRP